MPEIIVKTIAADGSQAAVMLRERVNSADFESSHFAAQLVERVGWAVADANAAEQAHRDHPPSGGGIPRSAAAPPTRPQASVASASR